MSLQAPGAEHLAILRSDDGEVVGHSGLYGLNSSHRTAFFEASLTPVHQAMHGRRGVGAVALALWFLLAHHDLRKVYLETTEARLSQFASLLRPRLFTIEGRLVDHVFADGRYQDALILGARGDDLRAYLGQRWARLFEQKPSHGPPLAVPSQSEQRSTWSDRT